MTNAEADAIIRLYAADILASEGMAEQQTFVQHGSVTVYDHSLGVARACLAAGKVLPLSLDVRSLVRGALLHDYFGYDWHEHSERSKGHALHHARRAADRALSHFSISELIRRIKAWIRGQSKFSTTEDRLLIHNCQIGLLHLIFDLTKQMIVAVCSVLRLSGIEDACMHQHVADHDKFYLWQFRDRLLLLGLLL